MGEARHLTAREAAEELGVSRATLYAYVSRGMIRSEAAGGRSRRYRAEDVRRLRERKERRRDPDAVVEGALSWGTPVMESAITLVTDDGLYYRGRDVVELSAGSTVEEVAALIWTGDPARAVDLFPEVPELPVRIPDVPGGLPPVEAFQVLLPLAGAGDPAAYDLRAEAVARTGARIMRLMVSAVAGEAGTGLAETLGRGWSPRDAGAGGMLGAALLPFSGNE
jgi:citrate synthase